MKDDKVNGINMPEHIYSDFPKLVFHIDKWPNPNHTIWMMSGLKGSIYKCQTNNCGFRTAYKTHLNRHQNNCVDKAQVVPTTVIYG